MDKKIKIRLIVCFTAVVVAAVFVFITSGLGGYLIKGEKYFENDKIYREKIYAYQREFILTAPEFTSPSDDLVNFTIKTDSTDGKTTVTLTVKSAFGLNGGKVVTIVPLDTTLYESFVFTASNGDGEQKANFVSEKKKRKSTVYTFTFDGENFTTFTVKGFLIREYQKR